MEKDKHEKTPTHPDVLKNRTCASSILERKHSSGDLQSRLKTRKILGVGETDNGDVHRSKISQVLGHNEHLFVKFPRCYWLWHLSVAVYFTIIGITNICSPMSLPEASSRHDDLISLNLTTRFYGSVLLGFAFLLWSFFGTTDKSLARGLMSAIITSQLAQLFALLSVAYQTNIWNGGNAAFYTQLSLILGCGYYFRAIGSSKAGLRKTLSNKDLREKLPTPDTDRHNLSAASSMGKAGAASTTVEAKKME